MDVRLIGPAGMHMSYPRGGLLVFDASGRTTVEIPRSVAKEIVARSDGRISIESPPVAVAEQQEPELAPEPMQEEKPEEKIDEAPEAEPEIVEIQESETAEEKPAGNKKPGRPARRK